MRMLATAALVALAGCTTGGPPRSDLSVTMTGLQEVPGPGDSDGTGIATLRAEPANERICWRLYANGIDAATAAHIHRGAEGSAGPPVVPLTPPAAGGRSEGCAPVAPALARELSLQPHRFYVNVHTAAFPGGAIRGQLRGGASPERRVPTTR
ncbi:MAG TPA: CHRD domain-containing protein [Allosphingosinicella sp.]|jgi:hypothetical protein